MMVAMRIAANHVQQLTLLRTIFASSEMDNRMWPIWVQTFRNILSPSENEDILIDFLRSFGLL